MNNHHDETGRMEHTKVGTGPATQRHPVFHTGHKENLLFPHLHISSEGHLAGACVVIFLVALIYEGLRLFVSWLQVHINSQPRQSRGCAWALGTLHTVSYLVHLFVGYCLMLVFMTLNVWFCLALLLGAGTGFVLFHFRPVRSRLFRFLGMGDNSGTLGEDDDRRQLGLAESSATTVSYKGMEEYRLSDCGKK